MKKNHDETVDDLRPEYDFDYSEGKRGKHYRRLMEEGNNVIVLDPELSKIFPDSIAVNRALRLLLSFSKSAQKLTKHTE